MAGTGAEPATNGSSQKQYAHVALRLHVPSPSSLADPFVTGTLDGSPDSGPSSCSRTPKAATTSTASAPPAAHHRCSRPRARSGRSRATSPARS
jgi:hypothetical protein